MYHIKSRAQLVIIQNQIVETRAKLKQLEKDQFTVHHPTTYAARRSSLLEELREFEDAIQQYNNSQLIPLLPEIDAVKYDGGCPICQGNPQMCRTSDDCPLNETQTDFQRIVDEVMEEIRKRGGSR